MFLKTFSKRFPKVQLSIEELSTQELIARIADGHLDGAIAATPLGDDRLKERALYYEPFVGYIPQHHRLHQSKSIQTSDLDVDDILLLQDGHCFREGVLNLCKANKSNKKEGFQLTSGSFETLIKLADEGLGMTLLPYLHTMDLEGNRSKNLRHFTAPVPAREISLIYPSSALKMHIIEALHGVISGIIRGAIKFQEVKIISPV
jgi:LysR family hydrogen peroxide-inducible transcriptional activator